MTLIIGALIAVGAAVGAFLFRRSVRDEVFDGLPPGAVPAAGQAGTRRHLAPGEKPVVAVRFNPPDGVGPGLAGVAIDGRVDPVELSATLIDLAGRGWLRLRPLTREGAKKPDDWELERCDPAPAEELTAWEAALLGAAFGDGPITTMSVFRRQPGVREASDALTAEVGRRGWLRLRPVSTRWIGGGLVALGVVGLLAGLAGIGLGALVGGVIFYALTAKLAEPLTAVGSAVRAQCEGFKLYLGTAEADRLTYEVGVDTFGRYLPYAMVFGVVDHWRSVFAEAMRDHPELEADGLGWLVLDDAMSAVILFDLLDGAGVLDSLVTDFAGFELPDLDGIGDAIGGAVEGIGDFLDL